MKLNNDFEKLKSDKDYRLKIMNQNRIGMGVCMSLIYALAIYCLFSFGIESLLVFFIMGAFFLFVASLGTMTSPLDVLKDVHLAMLSLFKGAWNK